MAEVTAPEKAEEQQVTEPAPEADTSELETLAPAPTEEAAPDTSAEESAPVEFDFDAAWSDGAEQEVAVERELPGKSEDDARAEEDRTRTERYSGYMRDGETIFKQEARRQGVEDEQAEALWQAFRLIPQEIHRSNESMNNTLTDAAIQRVLGDDFETFKGQRYSGRVERIQAVGEIYAKREASKWAQVLGFDTPEKVKKHAEQVAKRMYDQGRGVGEGTQDVKDTGQSANGRPSGGRKSYASLSKEEREAIPDRDAYIAQNG